MVTQPSRRVPSTLLLLFVGGAWSGCPPLLAGMEILLLELKVGLGIGNKGLA